MATGTSFKQQCPSCEAMVPIKDPSLVGRKIDCPKCKYRFKVEEPPEIEEEEDEAPRSDKGAITKGKPGDSAKGKPAKAAPRRDDEDDEDRPKKKKKAGSSATMMIVGSVLALVAVCVLGVCGWLLIGGSDDPPKPTPSSSPGTAPVANIQPNPTPTPNPAEKPAGAAEPAAGAGLPVASDITNLLPNDTQVVISIPFTRASGTALRAAFFDSEGGFKEAKFKNLYGFGIDGLARVEIALNLSANWIFTVVRTMEPVKEEQLKQRLQLKLDSPIKGAKSGKVYDVYLIKADLDSLSNLLFKGGQAREQFQLFLLDSKTLVFADPAPMKKFLEADTQPERIAKPVAAEPAAPAPPVGFRPGGVQPGTPPEGSQPEGAVQSYLTVSSSLKAMLDRLEKGEGDVKSERTKQSNILTVAADFKPTMSALAAAYRKHMMQDSTMAERVQFDLAVQTGLVFNQVKTIGVTLADLREEKIVFAVGQEYTNDKSARDDEKLARQMLTANLPLLEEALKLKLTLSGTPGGTQSGGIGALPRVDTRPPPTSTPGALGMTGRTFVPPPTTTPRPPLPGTNPEGTGTGTDEGKKDGTLDLNLIDKTLVLALDFSLSTDGYKNIVQQIEGTVPLLKGFADLSSNRWRVHELAAASQAYFKDKGAFPRGAQPRTPSQERGLDWRPDQRLSWAVELLPYLAGEEAGGFDKEASWNEGKNQAAARRVIPQFLNLKGPTPAPAFIMVPGQDQTHPFAATHFVGVAGVGLDAAEYRADDEATAKKRGVFGYDRVTRKEDIKDKLSETIVFLQVPGDHKGAWMAGGGATVRGVSEEVDAVQPFVCIIYPEKPGATSKYTGKKGTLAIMADGKVRFIPADIDPNVFRAMCTIAGGEKIENLDDIAPVVSDEEPSLKADPGSVGAPPPPVVAPPVLPGSETPAEKPKGDKP
jgi:hypothetical protein